MTLPSFLRLFIDCHGKECTFQENGFSFVTGRGPRHSLGQTLKIIPQGPGFPRATNRNGCGGEVDMPRAHRSASGGLKGRPLHSLHSLFSFQRTGIFPPGSPISVWHPLLSHILRSDREPALAELERSVRMMCHARTSLLGRHHAHQAQAELTMVGSVAFVREERVPYASITLNHPKWSFALLCRAVRASPLPVPCSHPPIVRPGFLCYYNSAEP